MIYKTFDVTLNGYEAETEQDAVNWARGFVFDECEPSEQSIQYGRYIETVDGIEVYYDFGADYYFFCPEI